MTKVEEKIDFDSGGFWIERRGLPATQVTWASILLIEAFKQDLGTVDLLCLRFGLEDASIVVHEEMPGWEELVNVLPANLAGFLLFMQWFGSVALPTFAEKRLKLFARQS